MFITQTYKYKYNDIAYVGGEVPDGAEILETIDILNAEEGYILIRKSDKKDVGNSIWLHNGDTQDNYTEVKESPKPEME
jgi:hypothetical protein